MNGISAESEILQRLRLPAKLTVKFLERHDSRYDVAVDPYLLLENSETQIVVRQPFLFSMAGHISAVGLEESNQPIEDGIVFDIQNISVDSRGILIVSCGECTFRCFFGIQFGWDVFVIGDVLR